MSIPVRIGVVALLSLLSFLLAPAVPEAAPPADRCVGDDACTGNTGTVGPGSCIGLDACWGNTGNINTNACRPVAGQNPLDAIAVCETNQGDVGEGACRQQTACVANAGDVSKDGCVGPPPAPGTGARWGRAHARTPMPAFTTSGTSPSTHAKG